MVEGVLAQSGREWTERKWSWDATVSAYENVYAKVTQMKLAATDVERRMIAWES